MALASDNKVKRKIVFPERDKAKITKLMANIPQEKQDKVLDGLRRFNGKGLGDFKPIPPTKYDGKPVCRLTVGDFRILAFEISKTDGNGIRKFEIFKVGNRNAIYKKRK